MLHHTTIETVTRVDNTNARVDNPVGRRSTHHSRSMNLALIFLGAISVAGPKTPRRGAESFTGSSTTQRGGQKVTKAKSRSSLIHRLILLELLLMRVRLLRTRVSLRKRFVP